MNKQCQVSGVRCQSKKSKLINTYWSMVTFVLMFTVYCLLLIGCGGAQTPTLSAVNLRAIEYNQNATKALENGDYEKALAYYMEALKVNRSIENTEGIAVNLINMAVLYQKKAIPQTHMNLSI